MKIRLRSTRNATIEYKDTTYFHQAVKNNNIHALITVLKAKPATVNLTATSGSTALELAIMKGQYRIALLLLVEGIADASREINRTETLLHRIIARQGIEDLRPNRRDYNSCCYCLSELARLATGEQLHQMDASRMTILHSAVQKNVVGLSRSCLKKIRD